MCWKRTIARALVTTILAVLPAVALASPYRPPEWRPKAENWHLDQDQNYVDDRIDAMAVGEIIDVVLWLNHCPDQTDLARFGSVGDVSYQGKYVTFLILNDVAVEDAWALGADPRVAMVQYGEELREALDASNPAIKVRDSSVYNGENVEDLYPLLTGDGTVIAILDSGVDDCGPGYAGTCHEMFPASKYRAGFDCIGAGAAGSCVPTNPDDARGHGTHVAGIALGNESTGGLYRGIAPGAQLVDVKVLNDLGGGDFVDVLVALETLIERRDLGVDVVNLSFAGRHLSDGQDALSNVVNQAVYHGMTVVAAIGNCDQPTWSRTCPAVVVATPGAADDAITVTGSNYMGSIDRGGDLWGEYSVQGGRMSDGDAVSEDEEKPDLTAPGADLYYEGVLEWGVWSATLDTSSLYHDRLGTSMAAPHVAGCAALLVQAGLAGAPLSLKELLRDTAEDMAWDPHYRSYRDWQNSSGHGLLDCCAAVDGYMNRGDRDPGFDIWCDRPAPPYWWESTDITVWPRPIQEGATHFVYATVENYGTEPAVDFDVLMSFYDFSNDRRKSDICSRSIDRLEPGTSLTVSCEWTPEVGGAAEYEHGCVKAEVIYGLDSDHQNNCAQKNLRILTTDGGRAGRAPALFEMLVENETGELVDVEVRDDHNPNTGWELQISPRQFQMGPSDCPVLVAAQLDSTFASVSSHGVNLEIVGRDVNSIEIEMGGAKVVGQFDADGDGHGGAVDCDDDNFDLWTVPGETRALRFENSKDWLLWTEPAKPGSIAAVLLYDTLRADSPDGFAMASTVCVEPDGADTQSHDPSTPSPGNTFYYLVRAENPCGEGRLGIDSRSYVRTGLSCP
jgi:subtilisin family serine protease